MSHLPEHLSAEHAGAEGHIHPEGQGVVRDHHGQLAGGGQALHHAPGCVCKWVRGLIGVHGI
jgi:hypothetical protein